MYIFTICLRARLKYSTRKSTEVTRLHQFLNRLGYFRLDSILPY